MGILAVGVVWHLLIYMQRLDLSINKGGSPSAGPTLHKISFPKNREALLFSCYSL